MEETSGAPGIHEVIGAIDLGAYDEHVESLYAALKRVTQRQKREAMEGVAVGDRVKFDAGTRGTRYGVVEKVMQVNVSVREVGSVGGGRVRVGMTWRVPAMLLEEVDADEWSRIVKEER